MFLLIHKGEALAWADSMPKAKELLAQFRHQPGTSTIVHVDNELVASALDEQAELVAERDWKDESYLTPHHD